MCFKVTMFIFVIVFAHIMSKFVPTRTQWKFQGKAMPNSSIVWTPDHVAPDGMMFIHIWGDGSISYDHHTVSVKGHLFFHAEGKVPHIYYRSSNTTARAHVHLITGI